MEISYLVHLAKKITEASEIKAAAGAAVTVLAFFFDPVTYVAMVAVFCLIIIDFIFGVSAARATGDAVQSAKLRRTAVKIVVYFVLISSARITEHAIPLYFLDETVIGFLAATELMSILENAGRMGYPVPSSLIKVLGDFITSKNKK